MRQWKAEIMLSRIKTGALPHIAVATILLCTLLNLAAPSAAAGESGSLPGIGAITLDSYDCQTGALAFHVPVTNLPHMENGNGYLSFDIQARYERGPIDASLPTGAYNTPAALAPYTGDVPVSATLRPSIFDAGSDGPWGSLTTIIIGAHVSSPGGGIITSNSTFTVDCAQATMQTSTLVDQLIAQLVLLLQELLNG